jgi:hypothetical protein
MIGLNQVGDTEGSIGTNSTGSSYGDATVPEADN